MVATSHWLFLDMFYYNVMALFCTVIRLSFSTFELFGYFLTYTMTVSLFFDVCW